MQSLLVLVQVAVCSILILSLSSVHGHGRFIEPPSRSSLWRFGFESPPNYNDNELFCGGFQRQWGVNKGKCGVCGDPYDDKRQNEAGGKYANGIIARQYKQGQTITVKVDLTANHLGYFEFRLCPHNSPKTTVEQSCLDKHLLRDTDARHRFHVNTSRKGIYSMEVVLPSDVTCSQCVIQWKYNTGNSWGCEGTKCCVGCGAQEQFYGCADVAISQSMEQTTNHTSGPTTANVTTETATAKPTSTTSNVSKDRITTTTSGVTADNSGSSTVTITTKAADEEESHLQCEAIGAWSGNPRVTAWCIGNCARGFCPKGYCSESCHSFTLPQL